MKFANKIGKICKKVYDKVKYIQYFGGTSNEIRK